MSEATKPFRILPQVTDENEHFWLGGADGELRFLRCSACDGCAAGYYGVACQACEPCDAGVCDDNLTGTGSDAAPKGKDHKMTLTQEEQDILNGSQGPVMAKVLATIVAHGELFGAERLADCCSERITDWSTTDGQSRCRRQEERARCVLPAICLPNAPHHYLHRDWLWLRWP